MPARQCALTRQRQTSSFDRSRRSENSSGFRRILSAGTRYPAQRRFNRAIPDLGLQYHSENDFFPARRSRMTRQWQKHVCPSRKAACAQTADHSPGTRCFPKTTCPVSVGGGDIPFDRHSASSIREDASGGNDGERPSGQFFDLFEPHPLRQTVSAGRFTAGARPRLTGIVLMPLLM